MKVLLLDRDGIVNKRIVGGYVRTPSEFELNSGIVALLRWAESEGLAPVLITNQQGVGKGLMSEADLTEVHAHMNHLLSLYNVAPITHIYVCTSLAADNDPRRKPSPGMILEAQQHLGFSPNETWFVGDSLSDAEAGNRAGVRTMLVGEHDENSAEVVVPSLEQALDYFQRSLM